MPRSVVVYSDYVCPFCLLAKDLMAETLRDADVEFDWRPFELRPYPEPTLRVEDEYLPRVWRDSVYPMAERLGVDIVLPRVSPQPRTQLAFEGFHHARAAGFGTAYNDQVLRAFFQQERDIGDASVLTGIASEVGLEPEAFRAALLDRRYAEQQRAALRHAKDAAGVTVVPTILIGSTRITGVPDRGDLLCTLERLNAE